MIACYRRGFPRTVGTIIRTKGNAVYVRDLKGSSMGWFRSDHVRLLRDQQHGSWVYTYEEDKFSGWVLVGIRKAPVVPATDAQECYSSP